MSMIVLCYYFNIPHIVTLSIEVKLSGPSEPMLKIAQKLYVMLLAFYAITKMQYTIIPLS